MIRPRRDHPFSGFDCSAGWKLYLYRTDSGSDRKSGIQFKNIDEEAEMEFIVSGEKDGAAGYAIYRMIDGQPMDLFGDGMEDCC